MSRVCRRNMSNVIEKVNTCKYNEHLLYELKYVHIAEALRDSVTQMVRAQWDQKKLYYACSSFPIRYINFKMNVFFITQTAYLQPTTRFIPSRAEPHLIYVRIL